MASNKRKPTPSVFGKGNVMDEILSGVPTPAATISERESGQTASSKINGGAKLSIQATAVKTQSQLPESPETSSAKSKAGQGSAAETKRQGEIRESSLENDSKPIFDNPISDSALKNAETSAESERSIVPNSSKEHVDFLFSIELVDKMEEVFPRLRRQMPTGQRRAFSKSVFVEMCVAEILWDFQQAGDASMLNRMVKQFAEELSEKKAKQRSDENGR